MNTDKKDRPNGTQKKLLGIGTYLLANLLLLPLYFHTLIGVWVNMAPYNKNDPLEPCFGVSCTGPHYLQAAVFCLLMLVGFAASAYAGTKVGAFRDFWRAFTLFMLIPLVMCTVLVLIII